LQTSPDAKHPMKDDRSSLKGLKYRPNGGLAGPTPLVAELRVGAPLAKSLPCRARLLTRDPRAKALGLVLPR
jgi:hypothetical protein